MSGQARVQKVPGYCSLCIARCGTIATVENGRFTRLDPDPSHPTGAAICAKGRAAPELVYHQDRLTTPLRRTRPKGDADPGWVPMSWDEALDETAAAMRGIADRHGPQAVAFSQSSPSTTAIADSAVFVRRLMNAFGTPNMVWALDLCGWGRGFATRYAFGHGSVATGSAGGGMADIANSGCLILWGYNPSISRLTHATATVAALKRGMKLIVVDPRRAGLASKADVWLRVRPGTDGALALGLANLMIQHAWYDREFVRDWSNGPHLVRADTGTLLRESDLSSGGDPRRLVAWNANAARPVAYDPATGRYDSPSDHLALTGEVRLATPHGTLMCRPVFDHYAALCRQYPPEVVATTCWISPAQLEETARLIWQSRPVSYYAWSGHEHHANTTETARAMALLYALTGSFDSAGGNVLLPAVPSASVTGEDLPAAKKLAPAIGVADRPLGPARWNSVSAQDFYSAVLEGTPYPMRGLIGFEISPEAQSLVQFRQAVVPPPGQARPDTDIIFDLAARLGLSAHFWDGDIDAAYRYQLAASGLSLEQLRAEPRGVRVPLSTRYQKHAETDAQGNQRGFPTPSRKVEFWSETFREQGYAPLPAFVEPGIGPVSRPDLAACFPLVLTCAKPTLFCQTQHRALPSLRKRAPDPEVELHPNAAAARGIAAGDWVTIETPAGRARARAHLNDSLDPRVVVGEHGWWQDCAELGAPGYDPFGPDGANFNLTVDPTMRDPVSGTTSHRANLCEVRRAAVD